jgi:hypothetical protein
VRAVPGRDGLELSLEYEDRPDDVHRSQLFRVRDDDAIATMADQWHTADRTKTSEPRVIPIAPRLRAELATRRDGPNGEPVTSIRTLPRPPA